MSATDDLTSVGELVAGAAVAYAAVSTRLAAKRAEKATKALALQQAAIAADAKKAAEAVAIQQAETAAKAEAAALQAAKTAAAAKAAADQVAAKAEEAAQLLLAANARVTAATEETHAQLGVIHTLVNSTLTERTQDALSSKQNELARMQQRPMPDDANRVAVLTTDIARLGQTVRDRETAAQGLPDAPPLPSVAEERAEN